MKNKPENKRINIYQVLTILMAAVFIIVCVNLFFIYAQSISLKKIRESPVIQTDTIPRTPEHIDSCVFTWDTMIVKRHLHYSLNY